MQDNDTLMLANISKYPYRDVLSCMRCLPQYLSSLPAFLAPVVITILHLMESACVSWAINAMYSSQ